MVRERVAARGDWEQKLRRVRMYRATSAPLAECIVGSERSGRNYLSQFFMDIVGRMYLAMMNMSGI
jgi:hypothetical protein